MNSCDTRTLPPKTQHHDKRVKKRSITNQPNKWSCSGALRRTRVLFCAGNPPSVCTSGFVAVGSAMHVAITAISLLQRCLSHQPERRSPGPRSARNSSLWLWEGTGKQQLCVSWGCVPSGHGNALSARFGTALSTFTSR